MSSIRRGWRLARCGRTLLGDLDSRMTGGRWRKASAGRPFQRTRRVRFRRRCLRRTSRMRSGIWRATSGKGWPACSRRRRSTDGRCIPHVRWRNIHRRLIRRVPRIIRVHIRRRASRPGARKRLRHLPASFRFLASRLYGLIRLEACLRAELPPRAFPLVDSIRWGPRKLAEALSSGRGTRASRRRRRVIGRGVQRGGLR